MTLSFLWDKFVEEIDEYNGLRINDPVDEIEEDESAGEDDPGRFVDALSRHVPRVSLAVLAQLLAHQ